jgi:high-affinity Fe2+/Pb2+ permease
MPTPISGPLHPTPIDGSFSFCALSWRSYSLLPGSLTWALTFKGEVNMETYDRGKWGKDARYPDDTEHHTKSDGEWIYKGYETAETISVGGEYGFHVNIYCSEEEASQYQFFAKIGNCNRCWDYLVTDFPSVLMLIREILPLIQEESTRISFEIQEEEHTWKAKELDPWQFRKHCAHV